MPRTRPERTSPARRGARPVDDRRVAGAGARRDGARARALAYSALLVVGLVGTALAGWSMIEEEDRGARVSARLGLERVASHWDELRALLALPGLLFGVVLSLWAGSELHRLWRAASASSRVRRRGGAADRAE